MGVIDVLTKGFQNVHRHWWILLIPVLLDIFLWVGPQASIEQLVTDALQTLQADIETLDIESTEADTDVDWWAQLEELSGQVVPQYNAFSALRVGALGVPSLTTWGGARLGSPSSYEVLWVAFLLVTDMPDLLVSVATADFWRAPVWQIPNEVVWLSLSLTLTALGILLGGAYVAAIAGTLDGERPFWARTLTISTRFALFWVLRIVVLVLVGLPVALLTTALYALSPGLASMFTTVVLGLVTWLSFYGIFFIASLSLQDVSIWRAIWNSFNIVLRNFWPTVGLFLLINLIGGGLSILWQQLSAGSWLTLLGIAGNAYVGTSLVSASFIYFHDRYARWQEQLAELLRRTQRMA